MQLLHWNVKSPLFAFRTADFAEFCTQFYIIIMSVDHAMVIVYVFMVFKGQQNGWSS